MKHTNKTKSGTAPAALSQPQRKAPAKKQPTAEQIEKEMVDLISGHMEQFAVNLSIARAFYRQHAKMVTSPKFPSLYAGWYKRSTGEDIGGAYTYKAPTEASLRKELQATARSMATIRAETTKTSTDPKLSPATNLLSERGTLEDPPTTTYMLLAQHFEDGKQLEFLQEVELTYDENWKLRRYLAELRGLIPAKDAA